MTLVPILGTFVISRGQFHQLIGALSLAQLVSPTKLCPTLSVHTTRSYAQLLLSTPVIPN